MSGAPGVSFVIPVRNGEEWLASVLDSVLAQGDGRPIEVLVVEDGSTDRSPEILRRYAKASGISIVSGPRGGAAAALNAGIERARHAVVCQVDQDVILQPGWMARLTAALEDPHVGAAQGYYETAPDGSAWSRVMGRDLEMRYRGILGRDVNHVCTGNTAYNVAALRSVGLFDERLGYGYDNDMSYRLAAAGYRMVIDSRARSVHRWRDSWWTYLVQQYGFGYGRLDLVAKHRRRIAGDDVSQAVMMLHAPVMMAVVASALAGCALAVIGMSPAWAFALSACLLLALACERLVAGARAAWIFDDPASFLFVPIHLARDLAWVAAMVVWTARRLRGLGSRPSDSMRPRAATIRAAEGRR